MNALAKFVSFPRREGGGEKQGFNCLPVSDKIFEALNGPESTFLELECGSRLYQLCCEYVTLFGTNPKSFSALLRKPSQDDDDEDQDGQEQEQEEVALSLGLGLHEIEHESHTIRIVHQCVGLPQATNCGTTMHTTLVLFVHGMDKSPVLHSFCEKVIAWDRKVPKNVFAIYAWKARNQYWHRLVNKRIRPLDSVILPEQLKKHVTDDLTDFVSRETAAWYASHGLPYKRSLLFYGPPGTGKSSFICALAGALKRNVCFMQPSNPDITDDNLQLAVQSIPNKSIVVFEDIDALFDADRKSQQSNCPLTFSGLLNALDGIANPDGNIFILTTNYIDRLDSALIRAGRVDVKVKFPSSTQAQVEGLFLHFYPGESELAKQFGEVIASRYPPKEEEDVGLSVSMAALQQLFIQCRKASAAEALEAAKVFDADLS